MAIGARAVDRAEAQDREVETVPALVLLDVQLGRLLAAAVERASLAVDVDAARVDEPLAPRPRRAASSAITVPSTFCSTVSIGACEPDVEMRDPGEVVDRVVARDRLAHLLAIEDVGLDEDAGPA